MKAIEKRLPREYDKSFIVFREVGPFFPVPWHYHPEYELVLVTKSTGRRMVGDHIGYFEDGDLVFMGPRLPHVWVNDTAYYENTGLEADAIVIHFEESFLGADFLNIPEMENFKKFLQLSRRGLAIKGNTREKINALMKKMLVTGHGLKQLSLLLKIFDILSNYPEYESLASPGYLLSSQADDQSDRFSKVTEYIMRNFDRDIALPEIASVANMAMTTFCNFFKKHYGLTFVEYLHVVRIGHACKLLSEKNQETVIDIAYECGFNNLAHFNRQFKRIKKMTPTEYRRMVNIESPLVPGE